MSKLTRLQKTLPAIFKPNINPFIKALIGMWANGLEEIQVQVDEVHDQLFIELADGNYLNDLGKNVGVNKPSFVTLADGTKELLPGMADSSFRKLIPIMSFYPKQLKYTIISALDLFWGPTYSRSTITANNDEPYDLSGGKFLILKVDGDIDVTITFKDSDFETPAQATVDEVIAVINGTTETVTAISYYNYETASNYVRIYTNTIGTSGSIQITGGTANTAPDGFIFSTLVEEFIRVGAYEINNKEIVFRIPEDIPILLDTLKGSHHFKEGAYDFLLTSVDYTGGNNYLKQFNLGSNLETNSFGGPFGAGLDELDFPGGVCYDADYVYICDNNNQRVMKRDIKNLSYVDHGSNYGGSPLLMVTGICCDNNFLYITDAGRHEVFKVLKNTMALNASYGGLGAGNNQLFMPTGIDCDSTHLYICDTKNQRMMKRLKTDLSYVSKIGSLGAGNDQFFNPVDVAVDDFGYFYVSDYDNSRIVKRATPILAYVDEVAIDDCSSIGYDESGRKILCSDWMDGINERVRVLNLNLTEHSNFVIEVGDIGVNAIAATPTLTAFSAVIDPDWPGSFLFDTRLSLTGFALTSKIAELDQVIAKDVTYMTLQVGDSSNFSDDGGYLAINFGKEGEELLIPYLGVPNSTTLTMNPAYRFLSGHASGSTINLIEKGNFVPSTDGSDYPVYLINPNVAEELVTMLVNLIKAAGIKLRFEIDATEYKYDYLTNL